MRLYSVDRDTYVVDLGQVVILFYHGRPVAFKDFQAKKMYAITEDVSEDVTFRRDFKKTWEGKIEITGGQAELETKVLEALEG